MYPRRTAGNRLLLLAMAACVPGMAAAAPQHVDAQVAEAACATPIMGRTRSRSRSSRTAMRWISA